MSNYQIRFVKHNSEECDKVVALRYKILRDSGGQTVVVPDSDIEVTEADGKMFKFEPGLTLDDLVRAVNEVGAAPSDLMAILQALKQAGAIEGQLIII